MAEYMYSGHMPGGCTHMAWSWASGGHTAQRVQYTWLNVVHTWQSTQYTWQRVEGKHVEKLTVRHRMKGSGVGGARPGLGDTKKRGHAPCSALAPRMPPLRLGGCRALHALRFIGRKVRLLRTG